jgi:hypothetical protein
MILCWLDVHDIQVEHALTGVVNEPESVAWIVLVLLVSAHPEPSALVEVDCFIQIANRQRRRRHNPQLA